MIKVEKYLGIPFVVAGRDYDGCDCYGLYRLIFSDLYNKELPRYDYYTNVSTEQSNRVINSNLDSIFIKSTKSEGSMVLMARGGLIAHVGMYIGCGKVVHTTKENGVHVIDINTAQYRDVIKGFYCVRDSYLRKND